MLQELRRLGATDKLRNALQCDDISRSASPSPRQPATPSAVGGLTTLGSLGGLNKTQTTLGSSGRQGSAVVSNQRTQLIRILSNNSNG